MSNLQSTLCALVLGSVFLGSGVLGAVFLGAVVVGVLTLPAAAQGRDRPNNGAGPPRPELVKPDIGNRIAWYGTLQAARAEAKRTGRAILFVSAAPHCGGTPGVW